MTDRLPLAHALLNALKDYGAGEIFGIPGDFALPFFKEIEAAGTLPLYTLSHEPGVGFAADAAGRFRSSLGVAAITYGAGGLNMVNPVACAYAEKSPLVVISGAPGAAERELDLGLHHQVKGFNSQLNVYREVTAAQAVLDDAATAPAEIARVLSVARLQSLPVYIEFPRDMVLAEVSPVPAFAPPPENREAAAACAAEVMERLTAAERPIVMLGVEIRRYGLEDKVTELAKKLGIAVTTSFLARGVLADPDAPLAGTYLGLAGNEPIREAVEGADCLLMLGVILCDTNFGVSAKLLDRRAMIHAFGRDVQFAHHRYPNVSLPALIDAMLEIAEPLGHAQHHPPYVYPSNLEADDAPILPRDVAAAVNDLFAERGAMPIASDMGDCLFTAMDMVNTELVAPAYYATMGTGIPMGFGLEAASGERPLVLVGDGAFQMTGWELGNANRLGLKPIVLMLNNTVWGMLKVFQEGTGYNDLGDWNFARIAESLGGRGHRAATRKELAVALRTAHDDTGHWHLVEAMIPPGEYSDILNRFVGAIQQKSVLGHNKR